MNESQTKVDLGIADLWFFAQHHWQIIARIPMPHTYANGVLHTNRTLFSSVRGHSQLSKAFILRWTCVAGMKKYEFKGKSFHEECFCCKVCRQPIGVKTFIPRDQEAVCVACYEEQYAQRCVKCNGVSALRPLIVVDLEKKYIHVCMKL